jgi:uncharacterized protein with HEPN domain
VRPFLPFRDAYTHLQEIAESIDLIGLFIKDMNFDIYKADAKTKSAVERQLQIITEAAVRLGDDGDRLAPGPNWRGYRAMGNILRHQYHRVDDQIVWNTVMDELPPLKTAVSQALKERPAK